VLAFEGIGPIDALKRSAHLFRQRWGQQVTGNVVIGGIAGLVGAIIAVAGVALVATSNASGAVAGVVIFLVGLVLAVAGLVFSGAVRGVLGVALYRWVADDQAVGPFTAQDLDSAARVA
jgi:hypothetical protein